MITLGCSATMPGIELSALKEACWARPPQIDDRDATKPSAVIEDRALQMCTTTERHGCRLGLVPAAAWANPAVRRIYIIINTVTATMPPNMYDRI